MYKTDNEITDFGEKIGGARKDLYKSRGLKVEDLDDINLKELAETVVKETVWPVPNYAKLVENGMKDYCAYFMKFVRDKLASKIDFRGDNHDRERAEAYINFAERLKQQCLKVNSVGDITEFSTAIKNMYYSRENGWARESNYLDALNNTYFRAIHFSYADAEDLMNECKIQNFPVDFKGALKGILLRGRPGSIYIYKSGYRLTKDTFETKEEAIKWVQTEYLERLAEQASVKKVSKVVNVVRPQLEHIERIGPDLRHNQDVTTDNMMQGFKFRGGEFGNWNNQKDRQACINYAFDSLVDLCCVLNVPLDFVSLGPAGGMRLAIAFGARGKGRALAHYEPARVVINLTKLKGAGSLAHEWGHAFDDYLGQQCGLRGLATYLSQRCRTNMRYTGAIKQTDNNVSNAMMRVVQAMCIRNMTNEERLDSIDNDINKYIEYLTVYIGRDKNGLIEQNKECETLVNELEHSIKNKMPNKILVDFDRLKTWCNELEEGYKVYRHISHYESIITAIHRLLQERAQWEANGEFDSVKTVSTNFLKCANKLDEYRKVPYYSDVVEMFARSFEAFVEDKLGERGLVSQYLVHSTGNNCYGDLQPYPSGEERVAINKAIENLVNTAYNEYKDNYGKVMNFDKMYESKGLTGDNVSYRKSVMIVNKKTGKEIDSAVEDSKSNKTTSTNKDMSSLSEVKATLTSDLKNIEKINSDICKRYMDALAIMSKAKLGYDGVGFSKVNVEQTLKTCNSKAFIDTAYRDAQAYGGRRLMLISSDATPEKQLEAMLECIVTNVAFGKYGVNGATAMLIEGATYRLCKKFGLDVRTYIKTAPFEELVKQPNQLNKFIELSKGIYEYVMKTILN